MSETGLFSSSDRHMVDEDRIKLTSVGVDIGSATSHLVFSQIELERQGLRYVTVSRTVLKESDILLTPYLRGNTIDGDALGRFIDQQYEESGLSRDDVDTGALILTGVALARENARAIAELFAEEAGKFVAVSAGDHLESTMAAHGSGAIARSRANGAAVLNVDVGGGTTKLTVCSDGEVRAIGCLNIGARLIVLDEAGAIVRLETAGRLAGDATGISLDIGSQIQPDDLRPLVSWMVDRLFEFISDGAPSQAEDSLVRIAWDKIGSDVKSIVFSGGVSEFLYGRQVTTFGDLGKLLGEEIRERLPSLGLALEEPVRGIRATVIGASQYSVQVSGSTIFISPAGAVPVRNVPVITPDLDLAPTVLDPSTIADGIRKALARIDVEHLSSPVAISIRWRGSATLARLNAVCAGIVDGDTQVLTNGRPLILVCDNDIGGLLGLHIKEELKLPTSIISIDGIDLRELDHIDIGALLPSAGAVPVVVKSLVFSATGGRG
ncbi:MAG: ethanolamine utilization protein EutA [Dehalococcoidia bacterium]|nr:ethanolamine utilization protein EutA [Dehalococcoidia bacterium]